MQGGCGEKEVWALCNGLAEGRVEGLGTDAVVGGAHLLLGECVEEVGA